MKSSIVWVVFIALFFITVRMEAQLRLPAIISSGMVLQQNDSATLWGWAGPGEKVFVLTSWNYKSDSTITGNGAKWRIKVKTPAAGGPYTITINSRANPIVLQNIMIGFGEKLVVQI